MRCTCLSWCLLWLRSEGVLLYALLDVKLQHEVLAERQI